MMWCSPQGRRAQKKHPVDRPISASWTEERGPW
jgi:hypothetical protein